MNSPHPQTTDLTTQPLIHHALLQTVIDHDLPAYTQKVYLYLISRQEGEDGTCNLSVSHIADKLNISHKKVWRALTQLHEAELIFTGGLEFFVPQPSTGG